MECVNCKVSDEETRFHRCPICFKWACDNCTVRDFGRNFCSKKCSHQFFFGDDEE